MAAAAEGEVPHCRTCFHSSHLRSLCHAREQREGPLPAGKLDASADGPEGLRNRAVKAEEAKATEAKAKTNGEGDRCPISGKQGSLDQPGCLETT